MPTHDAPVQGFRVRELTGWGSPGSTAPGSSRLCWLPHGNQPSGGHRADRQTLGLRNKDINTPIVVSASSQPNARLRLNSTSASRRRFVRPRSRRQDHAEPKTVGSLSVAPLGGGERPRRMDQSREALLAVRPCSWRTCGPCRRRRRSEPALVATHGAAAGTPCCRSPSIRRCGHRRRHQRAQLRVQERRRRW